MDISETEDDLNAAVALVLLLRKTELGLTYPQIAKAAGMGVRTLNRHLHGDRDITIGQLVRLARALQMEPDEVVAAARQQLAKSSQ